MPPKAGLNPCVVTHTSIPEELHVRLSLHLFSQVEGRVPKGAYKEFFCARIVEYFEARILDIAPWTGMPPLSNLVKGSPASIEKLKELLNQGEVQ